MSEHYFDSHFVSKFIGKFPTVQFDIDEDVAGDFQFDDVVSFLVTTRVENASFSATKDGDLRRLNVFKVHRVQPVTPEFAEKFMSHKVEVEPELVTSPVIAPASNKDDRVVIVPIEVALNSQDIVMVDEDDDIWVHPSASELQPIKSVGKDQTLRKFLEVD